MLSAVIELWPVEKSFAIYAAEGLHARPYFPVDLLPGEALFAHKLSQFFSLKLFVFLVVDDLLAVYIKEHFGLRTDSQV